MSKYILFANLTSEFLLFGCAKMINNIHKWVTEYNFVLFIKLVVTY